MTLKRINECVFCGGEMSSNPHPDAGSPANLLVVGAMEECIPCAVRSRHQWAVRAVKAEGKVKAHKAVIREIKEGIEQKWHFVEPYNLMKIGYNEWQSFWQKYGGKDV